MRAAAVVEMMVAAVGTVVRGDGAAAAMAGAAALTASPAVSVVMTLPGGGGRDELVASSERGHVGVGGKRASDPTSDQGRARFEALRARIKAKEMAVAAAACLGAQPACDLRPASSAPRDGA